MYYYTLDDEKGLLLGIHGNAPDTDDDFLQNAASSGELEQVAKHPEQVLIWIVITDPGMPAPSAAMRKRMAAAWEAGKAPRFGFCLVTSSSLMAGVFTAINWFLPSNPNRPTVFRGKFEDAIRWAEGLRGTSLPELRSMEHKLRARMQQDRRASA